MLEPVPKLFDIRVCMRATMNAIGIVLLVGGMLTACSVHSQSYFGMKDLKIEKSGPCPDEESNVIRMVNYTNLHASRNIYLMNSNINVLRNITGSLSMKIVKCTVDLQRCDYYDKYKVNDVCEKLVMKNVMWSSYVHNIHPHLACPIRAGTYKIVNGTFDFTLPSRLPIGGNRWVTYIKMFENVSDGAGKTKREQVWCLDSDVLITLSKGTRKRKRN